MEIKWTGIFVNIVRICVFRDGSMTCDVDFDEDEYVSFRTSLGKECPYFSYYDEYKMVRKQN